PLVVQLHPGATFIARAADSIYVDFASDARLISVNAADEVRLRGTGSLLDADNDDASGSAWNITTETLILDVEGSIGSGTGYLEIALGGTLTATAGGSIHLHEVAQEGLDGTMEINQVVAEGASGVARLKADGSIVDAGAPLVDVKGNSIVLTAGEFGFIGLSTNDLDIDTGSGTLTTTSGQNQYLHETSGDLRLFTVSTDPNPGDAIASINTAFIAATTGRSLNGNPGGYNVLSGKTWL